MTVIIDQNDSTTYLPGSTGAPGDSFNSSTYNGLGLQILTGSDLIGENVTNIQLTCRSTNACGNPGTDVGPKVGVFTSGSTGTTFVNENDDPSTWSYYADNSSPTWKTLESYTGNHVLSADDVIGWIGTSNWRNYPCSPDPYSIWYCQCFSTGGSAISNTDSVYYNRSSNTWNSTTNCLNLKVSEDEPPASEALLLPPPIAWI